MRNSLLVVACLAGAAYAQTEEKKPEPAPAPAAAPAPPAPAEAAPPAAPLERTIEKRRGDRWFRLTLRPANPEPGRVLECVLEVARIPDFPDPVYGDRIPATGLAFAATWAPTTGKGDSRRYLMHALPDAGQYAFHVTPSAGGLYRLEVAPLRGEGPAIAFEVGAGLAASQTEAGEAAQATQRRPAKGAQVKKSGPVSGENVELRRIMEEIGRRWVELSEAVDAAAKGPLPELAKEAVALSELPGKAVGRAPSAYISAAAEFDKMAGDAGPAIAGLEKLLAGKENAAMRAEVRRVEAQQCHRCHAKFRFNVTTELSRWPELEYRPWKK